MSTVKSTESRIFNFSVAESALMIAMAGLQVFIVRYFFQGARKGASTLTKSSTKECTYDSEQDMYESLEYTMVHLPAKTLPQCSPNLSLGRALREIRFQMQALSQSK